MANKRHLNRIYSTATAIIIGLALIIVLPFLPGDFDPLALSLSIIVQLLVIASLIPSLVAVFWFSSAVKNRNKIPDINLLRGQKKIAKIYGYTLFIVFTIVVVISILNLSLSFGIIFLMLMTITGKSLLRCITGNIITTQYRVITPVILTFLPIALIIFQIVIASTVTNWSRNKAIINSRLLIADLENWKTTYGRYPQTLNAVHKDYKTGIRGIEKYQYSSSDNSYNLYFEQPKFLLDRMGTREIVVYNPLDNHVILSHASWNTNRTPDQLIHRQGWYHSGSGGHPHWRYFWFD